MNEFERQNDLLNKFHKLHPHSDIELITHEKLNVGNRQYTLQFLDFARQYQAHDPTYETAYLQLVRHFVLQGSRANHLATLKRRLRSAIGGQSSLVLITGAAGIGKTSLALDSQIQANQLGAVFSVGHCYEQGSTPYKLWQDVIRVVASVTNMPLDDLPSPFGKQAVPKSAHQLFQALADWLMTCAASVPLVLMLDDLHWADVDSLEMLNLLTEHLVHASILFIATYRSEEAHFGHPLYNYLPLLHRNRSVETLQLQPLSEADTIQLVEAYHGTCHPQLAAYLYRRAAGHLLFTVELLRDLIEQGLLSQNDQGVWLPPDQSMPVPTLLKQVILQRVARVGDVGEKILSHAAVVGETWQLAMVEYLVELPEDILLDTLENAVRADIIVIEDDKLEIYRFSHGLIKEVLYRQHIARRRKRLHERIAAYLEDQIPHSAAQLAHHFYEAENWGKAFQYCFEAGEEAAKNFANNRAIEFYQKALDAAQSSRQEIDSHLHIELYERLGHTYRVLDQQLEAEAAFSRMRDMAHSMGNAKAEGIALVNLALVRIAQYRLDVAEQTVHEALNIAEQLGDPRLLAKTYGSLGKVLLIRGDLDSANYYFNQYHHHKEVLQDYGTQSDILRNQSYQAVWEGKYAEAEVFAQKCLEQGLKTGDLLYITGGYQVLALSQIEAGKYVEAHRNITLILDQTKATDPYHHQLTRLLNQMGYLYLELGDAAQALIWDQRALEASQFVKGTSRHEMKRYSLLNIATDLLYLGKVDEALEYTARFEGMKDAPDYARFRYQNRYLLLLCELHLAQHKYAQAIELAQEARALAQHFSAIKNITKSHWFEGQALLEMQQRQKAVQQLEQAVEIVDEIQHGSLRWKFRISLAKTLMNIGESTDEITQKALALISQTKMSLADSPLRESFNESYWLAQINEPERKPSPEKSAFPAGLTQREVEVLRLVASGATNQQIADALTISHRTVNTHITHILNKINCENRTAATAYAIQHRLV